MSDETVTMKMSELRELADSIAAAYEPRISRLERFSNRLAREIADIDNSRMVLSVEGEGLDE
jgi:hypothetical protein